MKMLLLGLFFDQVARMNFFVPKIGRDGFGRDIRDVRAVKLFFFQAKIPVVRGKEKKSPRSQPVQATINELGMVALGVQHVLHHFAVAECGRIEDDQVVPRIRGLVQPLEHIGAEKPMLSAG